MTTKLELKTDKRLHKMHINTSKQFHLYENVMEGLCYAPFTLNLTVLKMCYFVGPHLWRLDLFNGATGAYGYVVHDFSTYIHFNFNIDY